MISQADILRTLINNNCTDESVMSTALSPDCTPPKLMEKLTEAERFDLALDISMKLGLDVMPLWRTWAMRCLKNRNFQGARDKFRHCFLRLRLPGGRTSPVQSKLLCDILNELTKMDEIQLPLTEEIEQIKQRKRPQVLDVDHEQLPVTDSKQDEIVDDTISREQSVLSKPKIYAECIHYLTNYGAIQDRIRFYARNFLWDEAIKIFLEKSGQINLDKFFVGEVLLFSTSIGHLSDLVASFLKLDPKFINSSKYFKAIYSFCIRNRRYHVLYYIQYSIGDYIAAANTQINFFFLKKPVQSYRELNQRITSLLEASKNYQNFLDKLTTSTDESEPIDCKSNSSLFSTMDVKEVHAKIKLINLQIDITRNFALNEVSGCVGNIDLSTNNKDNETSAISTNDSPITLFELDLRRKTFLAALVLIYFDLSCSSYFSKNGLELASQLIDDYELDRLNVYKTAMRILIDDESCDILEGATLLLERIKEDYLVVNSRKKHSDKKPTKATSRSPSSTNSRKSGKSIPSKAVSFESKNYSQNLTQNSDAQIRAICDEVIRDSIRSCNEADYKMELAKLLSGEAKIELYIEQGKLSNAQRLACSMNRPDYVNSIIKEAGRLNQNHVETVCQLWLAKHETKNPLR